MGFLWVSRSLWIFKNKLGYQVTKSKDYIQPSLMAARGIGDLESTIL